MRRLIISLTVAVAATSLAIAARYLFDMTSVVGSPGYELISKSLLAVGLYASTYGIDLQSLRKRSGTIVLAVTVGVVLKAALITAVMLGIFSGPEFLLVGIAVAQIDPLSVASIGSGPMSADGRTMLMSWASFDDPVTMLLTLTLASTAGGTAGSPTSTVGSAATGLTTGFAYSTAFVGITWLAWMGLTRARKLAAAHPTASAVVGVSEVAFLAAAVVVAVALSLLIGLAVAGLFLRPRWLATSRGRIGLDRATDVAYYLAVCLLGFVLQRGIALVPGVVLGITAFGAQAVVTQFVARRVGVYDRVRLSVAQQNGITAILLGLILEPDFPGTLGVIAPAVLVINTLNLAANHSLDRVLPHAANWLGNCPSGTHGSRARRICSVLLNINTPPRAVSPPITGPLANPSPAPATTEDSIDQDNGFARIAHDMDRYLGDPSIAVNFPAQPTPSPVIAPDRRWR